MGLDPRLLVSFNELPPPAGRQVLGEGSFGRVYAASSGRGQEVALKEITVKKVRRQRDRRVVRFTATPCR